MEQTSAAVVLETNSNDGETVNGNHFNRISLVERQSTYANRYYQKANRRNVFVRNQNLTSKTFVKANSHVSESTSTNLSIEKEKKVRPWFIWILSIIQIGIFLGQIINNFIVTKQVIETDLSINPLIGPSPYVLINMGSSFPLCMHSIDGLTTNLSSRTYPCPNSTNYHEIGCTLSELCGFEGITEKPNQWYRFVLPIFLHAGFVHIILNLFTQLIIATDIEKQIGILRLIIIYFFSGIFGFILGGNFASEGLSRMGCSGCLFGVLSISFLHLFYQWKQKKHPCIQLIIHIVNVIINFVLGLLPGVDNFSHVGGFFMGLFLGIILLGSPNNFKRIQQSNEDHINVNQHQNSHWYQRLFSNRPRRWWIWCLLRFLVLILVLFLFAFLLENFYSQRFQCSACAYISCLPINGWCDVGKLNTKSNH